MLFSKTLMNKNKNSIFRSSLSISFTHINIVISKMYILKSKIFNFFSDDQNIILILHVNHPIRLEIVQARWVKSEATEKRWLYVQYQIVPLYYYC